MKFLRFTVDMNADETSCYLASRADGRGDRYLYFYISRRNIPVLPKNQQVAAEYYTSAVETCHGYTVEVEWPKMLPGADGLLEEDILRLAKLIAIQSAALIISGRVRAEDWDKYEHTSRINVFDRYGKELLRKLV